MFAPYKSVMLKFFFGLADNSIKIGKANKNNHNAIKKNKEKNKKKYVLPHKQFQNRESLLTQLFEENRNIRAVYNIITAFFVMFIVTCTLREYKQYNRLPKALYVIQHCFGKLGLVCLIWIGNNITTFLTYFCFVFWGRIRQKVHMKKPWDILCISMLAGYYVSSFVLTTMIICNLNLPFASSLIVSVESIRFLMKVHAFVRENAPKVLLQKSEEDKITLPTFSKFVHFLYVPTVVYRDEYPKSKKIRWSFICFRVIEIFAVIVFLAYWYEYITTPIFKATCLKNISFMEVSFLYFEFCIPTVIMVWSMFFVLLHSSQNAVGEALRFGDRLFYGDWWTCTDVQQYYRKWNMVIGDWLYTYIHKDMYEIIAPGRRNLAKFVTIVISALAHEWICTLASGYFLPLLTIIMLCSAGLCIFHSIEAESNVGQVIAILAMMLGTSCIATSYALEHFTRKNFPAVETFMSAFWTENCITL